MTHGTLLTFILICGLSIVAGQNPQYVLKGEEIHIVPNIPARRLDEILWKHDGNKVVEFNGREMQAYGRYQNRITLFWDTAELSISKVQLEDSGTYELELFTDDQLFRAEYSWQVLAKVAKPTITCRMKDANGTNTSVNQATLVCSLGPENPPMTKFAWSFQGHNVHNDPSLTISLKDRHRDHLYTCYVSNPKSQNSTEFNAKDCYPDDSWSLSLVWIVVPVVAVIILIVLLVIFRKRLTARCAKEEDEEAQLQKQSPQKEALLPPPDETPSNTQGDTVAKEGDRVEETAKELWIIRNQGIVREGRKTWNGRNHSAPQRPNAAANQNLPEEAGKTDTAGAENSDEEDRESDDPSPTDNETGS